MKRRPPAPLPYTDHEQSLLARHPDLVVLHRSEWERAAAHLDDAALARRAGVPCPWCHPGPNPGPLLQHREYSSTRLKREPPA